MNEIKSFEEATKMLTYLTCELDTSVTTIKNNFNKGYYLKSVTIMNFSCYTWCKVA